MTKPLYALIVGTTTGRPNRVAWRTSRRICRVGWANSKSAGKPMPRAVRFDRCGGIDVLYVAEVATPGSEQVTVRMKAAGTNSGEAGT